MSPAPLPLDADARAEVREVIGPRPVAGHRADLLVEYLHRLNDHWGGLYPQHLHGLALEMELAPQALAAVAATAPFEVLAEGDEPAALTLRSCQGLACRMAGGATLAAQLPALVGPGIRVLQVPCTGRCDEAPSVLLGQVAVPRATSDSIVNTLVAESERPPGSMGLAHGASDFTGYDAYRAGGGYAVAAAVVHGNLAADAALDTLEQSGLVTATRSEPAGGLVAPRWRRLRAEAGPRVLVLNLASAGPGHCKERELLERDPHRILEGLVIAAKLADAEAAFIVLRDGYHDARELLRAELSELQRQPPCRLPYIELRRAAGGYVGGEPSAVLQTLQGARALPLVDAEMSRPLVFGRPVVVEQLEGLLWVRDILERGAKWFASQGRRGRKGLRLFGVSGRVRRPGMKIAPAGITLRELVDDHCGGMEDEQELLAWLPDGAAGGLLPARLADIPLDFDTLQPYGGTLGSAAIIVLGQQDSARDAALAMMEAIAAESCGQCTPCRVGSARAAKLMAKDSWDAETLEDLAQMIADTSICRIGRTAPEQLRSMQRYFRHETG